jgi:tRNA threonylcarbamoyladenosine biosynthesis protein TsaB
VGEERVGKPELVPLPLQWSAPGGAALFAAGSGFAAYPQLRGAVAAVVRGIREGLWPRAAEIARLAAPEVEAGRVFTAAEALPVYLRDNVAQLPERPSH